MIIWFWLCFILQLTLNCNVVDGPTLLFHQQYRVYHFYSSGWFLHRKGTDCIKNHRFSNYYHCNANEYEASRKWRVNIDRYGSCFYRMPATFRLSWRIDREGTGGRRWTEVPLFWGWPTSWSPKRIYHTMTTLCCLLSKLTSNTFILNYALTKTSYLTSYNVHIGYGLTKEEIIFIHILITINRDRIMRK